jgi:phage terminase large subunit GpA-like protein
VEHPDGIAAQTNHGKQLPVDILLARREVFPAIVPDGVALLTAGVDTQDDRFEITITGWGGMRNHGRFRDDLWRSGNG